MAGGYFSRGLRVRFCIMGHYGTLWSVFLFCQRNGLVKAFLWAFFHCII
jgi:hypothetical protein